MSRSSAYDDLGGHRHDGPIAPVIDLHRPRLPAQPPSPAQLARTRSVLTEARQALGRPGGAPDEHTAPSGETTQGKAERLLTTGRVLVSSVTPDTIEAVVIGDTGTYGVARLPDGWHCTCPCHGPKCSHARAVQLVTTRKAP